MFLTVQAAKSRPLTATEITEARKVFGDLVDYTKPRIFRRKYHWFQGKSWIVAPNGHLYWPNAPSDCILDAQGRWCHTFIHEMVHVYQHQIGMNVVARGLVVQSLRLLTFGDYDPYATTYEPGKPFADYNIEQQGELAVMIYRGLIPNVLLDTYHA